MTEGQKKAILDRLCSANADRQFVIAEAVRCFPDTPLYGIFAPTGADAAFWAEAALEADKHADMADYLRALAWFYTDLRPGNTLRSLIEAKTRVIKRGENTNTFWKMLGAME